MTDADEVDGEIYDEPDLEKREIIEYHEPAEVEDYEFDNNFHLQEVLHTAGTLDATDEQKAILFAPLKPSDIEINTYTGDVYLPWQFFAKRLTKAFPLAWTMIPQGNPKISTSVGIWGFTLMIKGVHMGFAMGQKRITGNSKMTYGDIIESTKSNALSRLCKGLGIGIELYDKDYSENWKKKYAYKDGKDWKKRIISPVDEVKSMWITAAIGAGIMKDKKDTAGGEELKTTLLETYTDLTEENSEEYLEIGLKKINEWKK